MKNANLNKLSGGFTTSRSIESISILFWRFRTESQKRKGNCTIYARVTIKGKRKNISTGIRCKFTEFDCSTQQLKNDVATNQMLQSFKSEITRIFADLRLSRSKTANVVNIFKVLRGESLERHIPSMSELINTFYKLREAAVESKDISIRTLRKEKSWFTKVRAFSKKQHGKNAQIKDIVPADATHFVSYLKKEWDLSHNVAIKVVAYLKRLLDYAVECEYIGRNPFMNFRPKSESRRGERLTEAELHLMETTPVLHPVANTQRDCFLFSCYTGLAWTDVRNLRPHHIHQTVEGDFYIFKEREKTQQPTVIPLMRKALVILQKYENNKYCLDNGLMLPLLTNEKVNIYLKEIANLVGIEKKLTYHVARRTAADIAMNKGVDLKTLTSFMGHASIKATETHYSRINPNTVIQDFKKKFGEDFDDNLIPVAL